MNPTRGSGRQGKKPKLTILGVLRAGDPVRYRAPSVVANYWQSRYTASVLRPHFSLMIVENPHGSAEKAATPAAASLCRECLARVVMRRAKAAFRLGHLLAGAAERKCDPH